MQGEANPNSSITALLRKVSLFETVEERYLLELAAQCRRRKYAANTNLFYEGDAGHTLYLLIAGHVNIQVTASSGEMVHIATRGPGEHFGELSLIDEKPRMADAVTVDACDMLMLGRSEFIHCTMASPQIALAVMASLADRLREAAVQFTRHTELDVLGRLAQTLLKLMEAHGAPEADGEIRLVIKLTQQQLADMTGATRESVNRALAGMKASKVVRFEGRTLFILNVKRLRQYCEI